MLAWSGGVLGEVGGVRAGSKANISATTLIEQAGNAYVCFQLGFGVKGFRV